MHSPVATPRSLDHLVLPTTSLGVAKARLTALGFTVAPVGTHPFGTANCCVHFADGTFLEPLAVADRAAADEAMAAGNVFVARDNVYRARHGEEGFSALVMATDNAAEDHARFVAESISAGEMLAFSRPFMTADGAQDTASFLLAFAADPDAPDSFFFTCERVRVPKVDRATLTRHANGAASIREVVLSTSEPARFRPFLETFLGCPGVPAENGAGLRFETAKGTVALLDPDVLQYSFGIEAREEHGLRLRAVGFDVPGLALARSVLSKNGISGELHGKRIIVPPAAGQGATFAFEAMNR
jgi:hypothetical protein